MIETAFILYMISVNLITFAVFGYDKQKARQKGWRVPEKTLFFLALLGGSVGAWMGMYAFRHKTRHLKFRIGIPAILAVQAAAILQWMRW